MADATTANPARRTLRFETVDDAIDEAEKLVIAEREGRLDRLGNWTLGQTLGHLATWASYPFEGYPPEIRPPLPVRMILGLMRNRILTKGMTPGVRIRGIPNGTLGLEVLTIEEGLRRFRAALNRLGSTDPDRVNPIFGKLTHEQWIQLNLRHAELHLSFHIRREPLERG